MNSFDRTVPDTFGADEVAAKVDTNLQITAIQIGYKVTTLKHIQADNSQPKTVLIDCKISQIDKL